MARTPPVEFFRSLGLWVVDHALSDDDCRLVRSAMREAAAHDAGLDSADGERVDLAVRDTRAISLEGPPSEIVVGCFRESTAAIARHFDVDLTADQGAHFLRYEPGNFFRAHSDGDRESYGATSRSRLVSAVLFLNDKGAGPEEYEGGDLVLYGLREEPAWAKIGIPFPARAGRLLAFRSSLVHEVTPVVSGLRYTAVTWYV